MNISETYGVYDDLLIYVVFSFPFYHERA